MSTDRPPNLPPTAVIGDVHGESGRLRAALASVDPQRVCILVGDYVNRGPDSRGVLQTLVDEQERRPDTLVCLRGNHDQAFIDFLEERMEPEDFIGHGGLRTLRSYLTGPLESDVYAQARRAVPDSHLRFLKATRTHYESELLFVSHAGWDTRTPSGRSLKEMAWPQLPKVFDMTMPQPRPWTVFGHYVQTAGKPFGQAGRFCIDTGCGSIPGHPLTVLSLPERSYLQT